MRIYSGQSTYSSLVQQRSSHISRRRKKSHFNFNKSDTIHLDSLRTKNSIKHHQDAMMPTVPPRAITLHMGTQVPGLGSLLISTGVIGDECNLCGNSFENNEASNLALRLPCVDTQCDPCARMWNILSSPTCLMCYGNFKCPRFTRKEAQKALPRLVIDTRDNTFPQVSPVDSHIDSFLGFRDRYVGFHSVDAAQKSLPEFNVDARQTIQPPSPLDSHIDSFLNFRDKHAAFHNAVAVPEDDANSSPGSPMREDNDVPAPLELSEDLLEALTVANNRVGTNFDFQDIETQLPPALLRNCTNFQLADRLTQACITKLSQSECDNISSRRSSQQLNQDAVDRGRCGIATAKSSHRCTQCRKSFQSAGHLRQHMIVHAPSHRTCSVCGQVLGNSNSRRIHERRHRETEGERGERLGKAKAAREQSRARPKMMT